MRKYPWIILLVCTVSISWFFLSCAQAHAARKARGEVTTTLKPGEDPCSVLKGLLAENRQCSAEGFPQELSIILVHSAKKIVLEKDQVVLFKAKEVGKTTGKVIGILDLPIDMNSLCEKIKGEKQLVFWIQEDGKTLALIKPEADFAPQKGQKVKIKVKEVTKVEGC